MAQHVTDSSLVYKTVEKETGELVREWKYAGIWMKKQVSQV